MVPVLMALRAQPQGVRAMLWTAWALHAATLAAALVVNTPRFGFAPALSITAWLVLTVYAVERQLFPQLQARAVLSVLGALAVLLALVFPGQPLQARSSPWLALHLALSIASYGLLAAAVVHAGLMMRAERRIRLAVDPHSGLPLLALERITFRFVMAGFALLTATLGAGLLFSEALYGRAWHWDHKAVLSVLAWLTLAALLLGRSRAGWRGKKAVRMLYAGATLLLLAYVGSRFVLEVLLGRTL